MSVQPFRLASGGLIDRTRIKAFFFEGRRFNGFEGDMLQSVLLAHGLRQTGKSERYKRPRGIYDASDHPTPFWQDFTADQHQELDLYFQDCEAAAYDVAVIGAGASGLMAALKAADMGANVVLLDQSERPGGWLLHEKRCIEGQFAQAWVRKLAIKVQNTPNIQVLLKTEVLRVVAGHDICALTTTTETWENGTLSSQPSQYETMRLNAKSIIWAAGATEAPLPFEDNDRPGIMLSSAMRAYLNRYAVACGERIIIATNNDTGYLSAFDLIDAGVKVVAIIDERPPTPSFIIDQADARHLSIIAGAFIKRVHYGKALEAVDVISLDGMTLATIACDAIGMSGGLVSITHPCYETTMHGLTSLNANENLLLAGSASGAFSLRACISSGAKTGAQAARSAGFMKRKSWIAPQCDQLLNTQRVLGDHRPLTGDLSKIFVDFERDFTEKDLRKIDPAREIEHNSQTIENVRGKAAASPAHGQPRQAHSLYGPHALGLLSTDNSGTKRA